MKKSTRIVKKLLALFLVVLTSINSFAAVVSDNDGSAFITKAEFEALKENFASQINNYNTSIDDKIDGAIASYLQGIKIEKETNIESKLFTENSSQRVGFVKNWVAPTTRIGNKYEIYCMWWYNIMANVKLTGSDWYEGAVWGAMLIPSIGQAATLNVQTYGSSPQIISQPVKNSTWNMWGIDDGSWWNVVPQAFCLSYYWHNGIGQIVHRSEARNVRFVLSGMSDELENGNGTFGEKPYYYELIMTGLAGGGSQGHGNQKVSYITNTSVTALGENEVTNGANANLLAGGNVNGTLLSVKPDDWNTTETTHFATFDVNSCTGYKGVTYSDDNNWNTLQRDELANWPTGLPSKVRVYDKKKTLLNVEDLVLNKWSSVAGEKVQYFSGIPLFTTKNRSIVEIELKFNSDESNGGTFQIKNSAFSNSNDLDVSNVVLYKDRELKESYLDADRTWTGQTKNMKIYIDAKADEAYWIKIKPNGDKPIYVNTQTNTLKAWEY